MVGDPIDSVEISSHGYKTMDHWLSRQSLL